MKQSGIPLSLGNKFWPGNLSWVGFGSGVILRILHWVQLLSMVEIDSCKKQLSISTIDSKILRKKLKEVKS